MTILMMSDLEGVAGVASFESDTYPTGKYCERSMRLLTAEINAAVAGLVEAGADQAIVLDAHGPGGICTEDLRPPAKLVHGRPINLEEAMERVIGRCQAAVMIGQHAMAGLPTGNLAHTQSSKAIEGYTLNGRPIGEIAQFALFCGAHGLPLIYLSGDNDAAAEAQALIPSIAVTIVKEGLGRNAALSLAPEAARQLVRQGAAAALRAHLDHPVPPLTWPGPFILEKRFFHTDAMDWELRSGAQRVNNLTVRRTGDSILDVIYR